MDQQNMINNDKRVCEGSYPVELMESMDFDDLIVDTIFHSDQIKEVDLFDSEEENESTENESSATAMNIPKKTKKKVDRTRTLVSERKRRGRMKDKLYALRALVPNITKMDKASIVGDAVLYVQQLQMQAKELKAEIADLESSLKHSTTHHTVVHHNHKKNYITRTVTAAPKTITQMDAFRVEEQEFYVRIQSNKGEGVAVSLYKAVESLSQFVVRTSNLTTVRDTFILTFTIGDCQEDVDVPNVKMWIARALVSQGSELRIAS